MKQSEPKTLRRELTRSQQAGPHPDADILTAFSEGTLSERERKELMAHLAICVACREVMSVSISSAPEPLTEEAPQVAVAGPSRLLGRTWLPWLTMAASVGVVIFSAVVYLRNHEQEVKRPSTNGASLVAKTTEPVPALPDDKQPQAATTRESKPASTKKAPQLDSKVTPSRQKPVRTIDGNVDQKALDNLQPAPPNSAPVGGPISRASPANRTLSAQPSLAFSEAAQVTGEAASLRQPIARPQWRINAMGQAQRSYGFGTWQAVLPDEKMRVVTVFGNDVWIGGEHQRLYHSSDNGTTWNSITLPAKDTGEHAITHVRFQTAQDGTVEAEDGSSWTTADGGKTWK